MQPIHTLQSDTGVPPATNMPWYRNARVIIPTVIGILAVGIAAAAWQAYQAGQPPAGIIQGETATSTQPASVTTIVVGSEANARESVTATGNVTAQSTVQVSARTNGTLVFLGVQKGDTVQAGQHIAELRNSTLLANLNSARVSYNNATQNVAATTATVDAAVQQAQVSVRTAEQQLQSAQIGLDTAKNSLENAAAVQAEQLQSQKENAALAYEAHLNIISSVLNQVDYLIDPDDQGPQLPGIKETLSATNPGALNQAESMYFQLQTTYRRLQSQSATPNTAAQRLTELQTALNDALALTSQVVIVLENTVTNPNFGDQAIAQQRNAFISLRSNVSAEKNAVQTTLQALNNLPTTHKRELDSLRNAVASAQKQYDIAKINVDNAHAALASAQRNREQQLVAARNGVQSAQAQINVIQSQLQDLAVSAPISGEVIEVGPEQGEEVNAGAFIARIATTGLVTIEVALPPADIARLNTGQEVFIPLQTPTESTASTSELTAHITHIDTVASEQSKKVAVEIAYENSDGALIPGTFVAVRIPLAPLAASAYTFAIPLKAVTLGQTEQYVFVVADGMARRRDVTLGETSGETVVVTNGLQSGDVVIVDGARRVEDGTAVSITP